MQLNGIIQNGKEKIEYHKKNRHFMMSVFMGLEAV
jgi:hypothetical protein